jgi:WD40 repeat protein
LELKQNAEHVSTSIEIYINHHIRKILALQDDQKLQSETLGILKSKANGTFLWVALVIEQLHSTNHWEVEDVLEEMPEGLGNIYGLILGRIDKLRKKAREICQILLSIVAAAKRPLHLRELLVFINSHWKGSEHSKASFELRDIRDMTKDCGAILSIRDDIIYFIHQSAKDYIEENAAQHIIPMQHQHYKMFETSLDAMSSVLKYDMYDLKDPAIHIDDIPQQSSDSDSLASIRYCCVFWVEHLVHGYKFKGFEQWKYFKDDQKLHSFLRGKFLCWVESLALMRSFTSHAPLALQKLKNVIERYCGSEGDPISQLTREQRERETQYLRQFADDAYRFLISSNECVSCWPLQLYFSAIGFEPSNSAIRTAFEQIVRKKFGPSPVVSNISQNQSSLLLRTLFIPSSTDYPTPCGCLLFSPDSKILSVLSSDENLNSILTLWRTETGYLEHSLQVERGSKIAFSPDSKHFISVSKKGAMKSWDIDKGSWIQEQILDLNQEEYPRHTLGIFNVPEFSPREEVVALSPNGDLVASLYHTQYFKQGLMKVWETKSASCICSFTTSYTPYAAFSPNSELLALVYKKGIIICHAKTGQRIKHLDSSQHGESWIEQRPPIFSPNARILVFMSAEKLCLWDTNTWSLLRQIEVFSAFGNSRLMQPAISPDSALIAASARDGSKLWSIDTGKCVARISGESQHLAFSPDWTNSSLVASQQDFDSIDIRLPDFNQNEPEEQEHGYYNFASAIISLDSRFVASKHQYHDEISIYNGDNGQWIHALKGNYRQHHEFDYLQAFSLDSKLLAFYWEGLDGGIRIWRVVTGESICLIKRSETRKLSSIAFTSDSKYLVAGNTNGQILAWRIDSGRHVFECQVQIYSKLSRFTQNFPDYSYISSVAISPNLTYVAAFILESKRDGVRLYIRHLYTGEWISLYYNSWNVTQGKVAFSADSAVLASITGQSVLIWDVSTGACLKRFDVNCSKILPSFDPINGRIFTDFFVFYKTSSWKDWETSPRLGYSYTHHLNYVSGKGKEAWILLDGKKNFYMPTVFRPRAFPTHIESAMSDSLLAFVSRLAGLVIIKIPTHREPLQQAIGNSDLDFDLGISTLRVSDLNLDAVVPVTDDFGLRGSKRRRVV